MPNEDPNFPHSFPFMSGDTIKSLADVNVNFFEKGKTIEWNVSFPRGRKQR